MGYWTRENYIGFGLGASSLFDNVRYNNKDSLWLYMHGENRKEAEAVDKTGQMEEFMFLGLRLDIWVYENGKVRQLTALHKERSFYTDKYVMENDTIMYGYGGHYISKYPKDAKVLIKVTKEDPLEGFMKAESLRKYKGSVQAISYKKGKLDVTVFANTLTNKAHQQDDYRYASNTIYSHMLGEACTADNMK